MKSRITIELDHDNQPIIQVNYVPSDDVRDKMVKKFMTTFGGTSCWATFYFENSYGNDVANSTAILRPIKPEELEEQAKTMALQATRHRESIELLYGKENVPIEK